LGLTDPFETDPSLEFFAQQSGLCPKLTASSGGYYLSGLHNLSEIFIFLKPISIKKGILYSRR
jgi:hypothetical protein